MSYETQKTFIPKVILDMDGGYDDAWALFLLLKADKLNHIKLLAVTCVNGNTTTDNVAINVSRVLEVMHRSDIPVFKGASGPILVHDDFKHNHYHGIDGFGDIYHTIPKLGVVQSEHAVNALHRLALENPKEISLIAVGPLTNVALTVTMFPEFSNLIKDLYIMGGNYLAIGNATRCAEFNFYADPESAFISLKQMKSPIVITPWETCTTPKKHFTWTWRQSAFENISHPFLDLMNPVETAIFTKSTFNRWANCDALCVAIFLAENYIKIVEDHIHATVELSGNYARGQMVIDHLKKNEINAKLIKKINFDQFKKLLHWAFDTSNTPMEDYMKSIE